MGRSRALLKSIVMVGASLTSGCSGTVLDRTGDGDGDGRRDAGGSAGAGGTSGGARSIEAGGDTTMTTGGAGGVTTTGGGGATASGGSGGAPVDCGAPQRLSCMCTSVMGDFTQTTRCVPTTQGGREIECGCDPDAPLTPEDCPNTQQFSCLSWSPPGISCSCNPLPRDQTDCRSGFCFTCHSYEPPVGCECVNCLVIR